jgi:DNA-binding transcriptional LysR family regulator
MQIETLKVFCDIIETRSFSKAASLNFISQSAVSQQVRGLEERYNRKLIERGKRSLTPTQAGEALYEGAKEILDRHRAMENRLQVLSHSIAGTLRVATIYSVGLHELPSYLKRFMRRYPAANVRLEYSRANRIYDDVGAGTVDLGIVAYPVRRSGLETIPFRDDTLVLITHPNHPFADLSAIDVGQLSRQPFVAFERDIPTRRAVDRILRSRGLAVNVVMEFDNIETIKRAVEIEAGVSIVPLITVQTEIRAGTLVAIPFSDGGFSRSLGILVRKGRERTQVMDKFIELLLEEDVLASQEAS